MPTKTPPLAKKAKRVVASCHIDGADVADASMYDAVTLTGARTVALARDGEPVFGVLDQVPTDRSLNRIVTAGVTPANVAEGVDTEADAPARFVAGDGGKLRPLGDGESPPDGGALVRAFDSGPRGEPLVVIR